MGIRIKFWGVRGSIPSPGPDTIRYGGNTICLEARCGKANRLVIIDAGSGIRSLGNSLMAADVTDGLREVDIFLTHTHWDHILGFPFFAPLYIPGMTVRIHGSSSYEENHLEKVIGGQFMYRYFPVRVEELASIIEYVELGEGAFDLGEGLLLRTKRLNHPVSCMGYRFECDGKSFATVFDMEPFQNLFEAEKSGSAFDERLAREGEETAAEQNRLVETFYAGADLIIHDAQYTRREYHTARKGWGHSAVEDVIEAAQGNRVKRLALIHHDPERTDDQIDELAGKFHTEGSSDGVMDVFFAREGMEITL